MIMNNFMVYFYASVRWYRVSSKRLQTIAAVSYEFGLVFG